MMDPVLTFFLSWAGAMGIIIFTLWIFKLPPFNKDVLGEQEE